MKIFFCLPIFALLASVPSLAANKPHGTAKHAAAADKAPKKKAKKTIAAKESTEMPENLRKKMQSTFSDD